jgi:hypothetical protein
MAHTNFQAEERVQIQSKFDALFSRVQTGTSETLTCAPGVYRAQAVKFDALFENLYVNPASTPCKTPDSSPLAPRSGGVVVDDADDEEESDEELVEQGVPHTVRGRRPKQDHAPGLLGISAEPMSVISAAHSMHGRGGVGGAFGRREADKWCPLCVPGSNNLIGHRGKHRTVLPKKVYSENEECPECVKGCGRLAGHIGRHTLVLPRTKESAVPCPHCIKESGKMAGHRGRHTKGNSLYSRQPSVQQAEGSSSYRPVPSRGNGAHGTMQSLELASEYERERARRIEENRQYMISIGLKPLHSGGHGGTERRKKRGRPPSSQSAAAKLIASLPPRELSTRKKESVRLFADEQAELLANEESTKQSRRNKRKAKQKVAADVSRKGNVPHSTLISKSFSDGLYTQLDFWRSHLRRYKLTCRSSEIFEGASSTKVVQGTGMHGTKMLGELMMPGASVRTLYKRLRPPRVDGRVSSEDQQTHVLVARHFPRRNKQAWKRATNSLKRLSERLSSMPEGSVDRLKPFEYLMKNICNVCHTQVQNSRALISHKRACKRRDGQWGEENHMGQKVHKAYIRSVKNSARSNPRKLRRAKKATERKRVDPSRKNNGREEYIFAKDRNTERFDQKENVVGPGNREKKRLTGEITADKLDESEDSDEEDSSFFNSLFQSAPAKKKKQKLFSRKSNDFLKQGSATAVSIVASPPAHKHARKTVAVESSGSEWNPTDEEESEDSDQSLFVEKPPGPTRNRNFLQNLF